MLLSIKMTAFGAWDAASIEEFRHNKGMEEGIANPFFVSNTTRVLKEIELEKSYQALYKTDYGGVVLKSLDSGRIFEIPETKIHQIRENDGIARWVLLQDLKKLIFAWDEKKWPEA